MDPSRGGDSRYNLNYGMGGIGLSLVDQADLYGNPSGLGASGRPPSGSGGLIQTMGRSGLMGHGSGGNGNGGGGSGGGSGSSSGGAGHCQTLGGQSRGIKRASSDCYDDHHRGSGGSMTSQTLQGLESCGTGNGSGQQSGGNISDVVDDNYASMQNKKSPPANGKKTKGRVKIKMEYIDNKLRRYTTFSKRKTGIMKKAYELSTLTGTQVMLLVASETGHVYTFATRKLQPMITSEAGKQLIQTCLNSPDPPSGAGGGDQRMSATGFEETELSYNIADEDSKDDRSPISSGNESDDSSDIDSPRPSSIPNSQNLLQSSVKLDSPPLLIDTQTQQQSKYQNLIHSHTSSNSTSGHFDVLYPTAALGSLPQEVLLGLVQSGHIQLHQEEDSGGNSSSHQFITIPIAMTSSNSSSNDGGNGGNNSSSTTVGSFSNNSTTNSSYNGNDVTVGTSSSLSNTVNLLPVSSSGNGNKIRVKDLSTIHRHSVLAGTNGGRDSPSTMNDDSIRIKTEIVE